MRGRLFRLLSCLILSAATAATAQAASLAQQRQYYDQAKAALAKGDKGPYQRYAKALRDYPLEPYLAYEELTARLKWASNDEIEKFLAEHGDLPQASWMKLRWLRWLAERGEWRTFINHYDPALNFTELDCLYGQYQLGNGMLAEGFATAEKLWLVGKSQPNACDRLFELWAAKGKLTEEMRWKRAKLATEARNYGLASYLIKGLPTLGNHGKLLLEVAQKPQILSQTARFSANDQAMADVVGLGLRRLARQDPEKALTLLDGYAQRMKFSSDEKVAIAREIGLTLAKRFDARALKVMAQYDPQLRDNTVSEWRARLLLRLGRWDEAHQLTRKMPAELGKTNRWRYWQARSLQLAQPNSQEPQALYQGLAKERDFYGFMAADQVKAPYQLNNTPLQLSPRTLQKVRNAAGIRRAMEFHERGQIVDGRREWYHVSRLFSRDELVAQARLAYDMEW
jgi:soluble lytic murein transglycosylase